VLEFEEQNRAVDITQIRVSPQELAQALQTVEERKEAEARAQVDTIPLGQAIQALGVNYTPEEVLAALQANRARPQEVGLKRSGRPLRLRARTALLLACAVPSVLLLGIGLRSLRTGSAPPELAAATVVSPAPVAADRATVGLQTTYLSQIGVGQTFHCDTGTLLRLANGTVGADPVVEVGAGQKDLWIAARIPSGFEVQGWATTADALKLANGQEATLYRTPDAFSSETPRAQVHVPLKRLVNVQSAPNSEDYLTVRTTSTSR
jgi:hypothetical protein